MVTVETLICIVVKDGYLFNKVGVSQKFLGDYREALTSIIRGYFTGIHKVGYDTMGMYIFLCLTNTIPQIKYQYFVCARYQSYTPYIDRPDFFL